MPDSFFLKILFYAPPLMLAVILHEIAHGWVAEKLGDPTARRLGRITLNPLSHIDPFMTLFLPLLLIVTKAPVIFGGAKPVPINPRNFHRPRRDMALVAIAGPIVNFILAGLSILLLFLASPFFGAYSDPAEVGFIPSILMFWLLTSALGNTMLGLFNLLPILPLDGGRIVMGLLPESLARQYARLERWGLLIVALLLMTGVVGNILGHFLEQLIRFLNFLSGSSSSII